MSFISLCSDFGGGSHYIGIAKSIIKQILPQNEIIDLSHQVKAFNHSECIYFVKSALTYFPQASAHFILTNMYAQKELKLLYAYEDAQHFFCMDNGLLPEIFYPKAFKVFQVKQLQKNTNSVLEIVKAMSLAYAQILDNDFEHIRNLTADEFIQINELRPIIQANEVIVPILHIDVFENLVLNIHKDEFENYRKGRNFNIEFQNGENIRILSSHYSSVPLAEKLAWFNSSDYLEIAMNHGNFAGLFGFKPHNHFIQFYKTVKISFES